MKVNEGKATIEVCEGVFYNPHMKLSRDISVSIFSTLEKGLSILDAFTATGIRGIRYALEAGMRPTFLDLKDKAVECCKKNISINGIKAEVLQEDVLMHTGNYDVVELDPFGSPARFIGKGIDLLKQGEGYLSITATDAMMLCGIQKEATQRFYGSLPLHNEFCHETGLRIILKKTGEEALARGKGIRPLCSFYYRHQFKTIVEVSERHAEKTKRSIKEVRWGNKFYGPVWVGKLHEKEVIKKALSQTEVENKRLVKYLRAFYEEADDIPFFYSIPKLCKEAKATQPSIESLIMELRERGFVATRTHFSWDGIKTNASKDEVISILLALSSSENT